MASEAVGAPSDVTVPCSGSRSLWDEKDIGRTAAVAWRLSPSHPPFSLPLSSLLLTRAHESPCLRMRVLWCWV